MDRLNQSPSREVTLRKLKRDAENMRQYARFAVVLKGDTVEIIDNRDRKMTGLPYARIIAILGPVFYKGELLEESVLMEVGYSRTRPYAQLEERPRNEHGFRENKRWSLSARARIDGLTGEHFSIIYPAIERCMTAVVLELREKWKTKDPWWVNGPGKVARGIFFTVHQSDILMHRQMVLEDVRYRDEKYISGHAEWIRKMLGRYKRSYYTPQQLKNFRVVRCVMELLSQPHYTPFYRSVFCGHFAIGSHEQVLLEAILEKSGIDVADSDQEVRAVRSAGMVFPKLKTIRCYRPPVQPTHHARGASVFEILLEEGYRERNEISF